MHTTPYYETDTNTENMSNLGEYIGNCQEYASTDGFDTETFMKKGESLVTRYLNFDFDPEPFWHDDIDVGITVEKSVGEMLDDLIKFERLTCNADDKIKSQVIKEFQDRFVIQMCHDEEVGVQKENEIIAISEKLNKTINMTEEQECNRLETINMFRAYRSFNKLVDSNGKDNERILTEDILLTAHGVLMKGLIKSAGQFSTKTRKTRCPIKDKEIVYPSPAFVKETLSNFLDTANYIAVYLNYRRLREDYGPEFLATVFKFCAWFFYNFISLHPFGDGNGRMARLLYCYIQSLVSPFPVGIYNIFAPSRRIDYLTAIARTRERLISKMKDENDRRGQEEGWGLISVPMELARMILECQWYAWHRYSDTIINESHVSYESELYDSQSTPSL